MKNFMNTLIDMIMVNLDVFSVRLQLFIILPTVILLSLYILIIYYKRNKIASYINIITFTATSIFILGSIEWLIVLIVAHKIVDHEHFNQFQLFILYLSADIICAFPLLSIVSLVGKIISDQFEGRFKPLAFIISIVLTSFLIFVIWTFLRVKYGWEGPV